MIKVIEIVACLQCPNLMTRGRIPKCHKHQKLVSNVNNIPEWCTLDTKEEYLMKNRDD